MRLPRPRFTLRSLMVAVAIVGIQLCAERRAAAFRQRAIYHNSVSANCLFSRGSTGPQNEAIGRWRLYHRRMSFKYEDAARYPWLPVAPDSPEPTEPE